MSKVNRALLVRLDQQVQLDRLEQPGNKVNKVPQAVLVSRETKDNLGQPDTLVALDQLDRLVTLAQLDSLDHRVLRDFEVSLAKLVT